MGNILVPFKKFLSNKNTITILGVLLGVVVLYLGYSWRITKSIQPTQIPYAKELLLSGTKITETQIGYTKVPKDTVKNMKNILTDAKDIKDKIVSFDSKIAPNSFFFKENLITEAEKPSSIFSNIPDGYTIYNLAVDSKKTYGNSMMPGTEIDIYLSAKDDDQKIIYGRIIQHIEIKYVKDKDGNNVFRDKDNLSESAIMMFAVPEDLFLLLKKAEKLGLDLEPVGRNDVYSKSGTGVSLTSEELQAFIIDKTRILQKECIDITNC